ncbi:hypothetical protein F2Q70_00042670 [Brassica cretica]|uniref:Uncharacterized protein n=1 Tax=Brassica cretica TaxID=69181 RepID=A0A8S9KMV4_BRACR|nr:hypothetical protein F2Q70_00042670 [Brassica cretica]
MSGLYINVAKSTVFAAGRGKQALETAAAACGITVKAKPLVLAPNVDDGVKWKRGDVEYGSEFSAYSTWNMLLKIGSLLDPECELGE